MGENLGKMWGKSRENGGNTKKCGENERGKMEEKGEGKWGKMGEK